jgi:hypothetical protein
MSTGSGMAQSYSNMSLSGALLSDSHVRMSINNGECFVRKCFSAEFTGDRRDICLNYTTSTVCMELSADALYRALQA